MSISLSLHLVGIVMWLGGGLVLSRVLSFVIEDGPSESLKKGVSKIYWGWVVGGLALVTLTGLYQLFAGGFGVYMKQGWFHGKATLVIALYIITALFGVEVKNCISGKELSKKRIMSIHGGFGVILLIVVLLTKVGLRGF